MPASRLPPIWTTRHGFAVLLTFVALLVLGTVAHMEWVKAHGGFEAYLGHGPRLPPKLLVWSQLIKATAIVVALALVARRAGVADWAALGIRRCDPRWLLLGALAALLGSMAMLGVAKLLATGVPDWARQMAPRYAWGDAPPAQMIVLLALTTLATPLVEEMFFRGFLFRWMASRRPLWLAIAISSVMFGASHIVPSQAIVAALLSVVLTLLYLGSRSIWPAVVCHALNNTIGVALSLAANAGMLPAALTPPH